MTSESIQCWWLEMYISNALFSPNHRLLHSVINLTLSHDLQMFTIGYWPITAFQDPLPLPNIPIWTSFCLSSCLLFNQMPFPSHFALIDATFILVFSTSSSPSAQNLVSSSGNVFPLLFYLKHPLFKKAALINILKLPSPLNSSPKLIFFMYNIFYHPSPD